MLIVGLGAIGSRLATLAKAFDLRVVGVKRDPSNGGDAADSVHGLAELRALLPQADFVALTCPLNSGNGKDRRCRSTVAHEAIRLSRQRGARRVRRRARDGPLAAGAAPSLERPSTLPRRSRCPRRRRLWDLRNALITPHTAGETRKYEDNVLDILVDNLNRLWRGESTLRNEIV